MSVNVRGVANEVKRKAIFEQHRRNADILVLLETHSTSEIEQIWRSEWGGEVIFSHGTSAARGVAMFVTKDIFVKINNIYVGNDGRTIICDLKENEKYVTIVAIYAPNEDSPQYFKGIRKLLEDRHEHKILVGDFNLTLDVNLDRLNTYCNNNRAKEEVEDMMDEMYLIDVWRVRNEIVREYSWRKGGMPQKASRIDFALVSKGMDQKVEYIQYLSTIKTDHRAIYMVIQLNNLDRGTGYWKLNCSLLGDKKYIEVINKQLQVDLELLKNKEPKERWERLKKRIKKETIEYSKSKASEEKIIISQLSEKVNEYEANLPLTEQDDQLLLESKLELEEKLMERTRGIMFRSKARWYEQGEKNTKYFFTLEKARYNSKTCYTILNEAKDEISDPTKILQVQRQFYQDLYEVEREENFNMENNFGVKVPNEIRELQSQQMTVSDIAVAVKAMKNNKTPGEDGIPIDFYKVFWKWIHKPLYEMIQQVYQQDSLHTTARRGILNLIPKPGKDTREIKNLRPITLLNSDYKIIEKVVANKMIPALEYIIHTDQRGFMKNRRISVNIRKMLDIIHEAEKEDLEAVILSLDFVKCFDRCNFSILHGSLTFFGFGEVVKKWTRILYTDFTVRIQNNGHFSEEIKINRGVHQGGCCSSIYFLVIAEILALSIRDNQNIEGITLQDIRNLLNQFADDMDVFSLAQEESLRNIFKELKDFEKQSGFLVSYDKTTLYRVGSLRHSNAQMYDLDQYKWSNDDISVLGVTIAHEDMVNKNYEEILVKVKKNLAAWYNRGLSLLGKIQVVNTLIASLFVYKMMVLPTIPKAFVKNIDNLIRNFLWNGKKSKIAYKTLQLPKEEGGLGLVDLIHKDEALKATWPKILNQEKNYAKMVYGLMRVKDIGEDIWRCNFDPATCAKFKLSNEFWTNVLKSWSSINSWYNFRIENQLLWYNTNILVKKKVIMWKDVNEKGLKYVHQLFENQQFKLYQQVKREYGLTELRFNSLKMAIPREWRSFFMTNPKSTFMPLPPHNFDIMVNGGLTSSKIYRLLSQDMLVIHNKYIKWYQEVGSDIFGSLYDFKEQHRTIYKVTNVPKYRSFQYRLLQRGLVTNISLYKWGLKCSDVCTFCKTESETITHLLWECGEVQKLWDHVKRWIIKKFGVLELSWNIGSVINNRVIEKANHVVNFICLITKQFIYSQKCLGKELIFNVLEYKFQLIQSIEKYIAVSNDKVQYHECKWLLYNNSTSIGQPNLTNYITEYVQSM